MTCPTHPIRLVLFLSIGAMAATGCEPLPQAAPATTSLPFYGDASFTPHFDVAAEDAKAFHQVPAFAFTDQNGEAVTEQTVKGNVYVTNFFFTTCPGICPKMTKNLKAVRDAFADRDDVMILSHSVTPDTDSVDVLNAYAQKNAITGKGWRLLTGDRQEIYRLGRHSYFVEEDLGLTRKPDEFLHTENFVLVDQNRHIRGVYNGLNKTSVQQLITDMKTLL